MTAGGGVNCDPIQVEDALGEIARTVTGKAEDSILSPFDNKVISAGFWSQGQILHPERSHAFDLFLAKDSGLRSNFLNLGSICFGCCDDHCVNPLCSSMA